MYCIIIKCVYISTKLNSKCKFHFILFLYFRRIYPEGNEEKYAVYFENSCSLFQETAASKARIECAR